MTVYFVAAFLIVISVVFVVAMVIIHRRLWTQSYLRLQMRVHSTGRLGGEMTYTTPVKQLDGTLCCGGSPDRVIYNPYNKCVQCHGCGHVWEPKPVTASDDEIEPLAAQGDTAVEATRSLSPETRSPTAQDAAQIIGGDMEMTRAEFEGLRGRIATALQSHADAARPKVSEDDDTAARELVDAVNKDFDIDNAADSPWAEYDAGLATAIASDRASVRDAARLAERDRIRGAVEAIPRDFPSLLIGINETLKAIDGQPEGGGG